MAVSQNPSNIVKVGYNGATKTGYVVDTYEHTKEGDLDRVSADGSILTYLASNLRDVLTLSLLVNGSAGAGGAGDVDPPAIGSTFTFSAPATTGEIDEDGTAASLEFIVTAAKAVRAAGAVKLDLTIERPTAMNFNS
jgi:hypothetical protein